MTDVEILRLHYAETLKLWREAFEKNRETIASMYDEKFVGCGSFISQVVRQHFAMGFDGVSNTA